MIFTYSNHLKTKFILLILGLALLFPMLSEAQTQVSFAWHPNSEPDLAGYRIFHRLEGGTYNYSDPVWEGSQTSCTITVANDEIRHYFVARAFDTEGFESQNSDEVCLGCSTDSSDSCPNDPNKTAPGICGCGTPDIDTDGDGTLDCNDSCPNDPDKINPACPDAVSPKSVTPAPAIQTKPNQVYAAATPDIDTDSDGTLTAMTVVRMTLPRSFGACVVAARRISTRTGMAPSTAMTVVRTTRTRPSRGKRMRVSPKTVTPAQTTQIKMSRVYADAE